MNTFVNTTLQGAFTFKKNVVAAVILLLLLFSPHRTNAQEINFPDPLSLLQMYRTGGAEAITKLCSQYSGAITTNIVRETAGKGFYYGYDTLYTIASLLADCSKNDTASAWVTYYRGKEKVYAGEQPEVVLAAVLAEFTRLNNTYGIYIVSRELADALEAKKDFAGAAENYRKAYLSGEALKDTTRQDTLAYNTGIMYYNTVNYTLAEEYLLKALSLFENSPNYLLLGKANYYLGEIANYTKQYLQAGEYYKSAYTFFSQANNNQGMADVCSQLAGICLNEQDYKLADQYYGYSLNYYIKAENEQGQADANYNLGIVAYHQALYSRAIDYFMRAYPIYEQLTDTSGLANTSLNIGNCYFNTQKYTSADEYYTKALLFYQTTGDANGIGNSFFNIANVAYSLYNFSKSKEYYLKTLPYYSVNPTGLANCYYYLADIYFNLIEYNNALPYSDTALSKYTALENTTGIANCYYLKGEVEEERKNYSAALTHYKSSLGFYAKDSINILSEAAVYYKIAQVQFVSKDTLSGEQSLLKALKVYTAAGYKLGQARAYSLLGDLYKERGDNNKTREYYLLAVPPFSEANEVIPKNIKLFLTVNSLSRNITAVIVDAEKNERTQNQKSDAQKLNSYFNSLNSYSSIYLSGSNATKQNITDTIAYLAQKLRKDDVFVFYYSGNGGEWTDSSGAGEKRLSHRFEVFPRSAGDTLEYMDIAELRNALNLILSVDQLILFNSDIENLSVLVTRHFAPDEEALINLYGKNRIFFKANKKSEAGYEDLVDILTSLPGELTLADFFSKPKEILADFYSKTSEKNMIYSSAKDIDLVFEKDLIEVIKEVILKKNEGLSRATTVKLKKDETQVKQPPKNYALLVGTNEYDDNAWRRLNNPVLDAKTVGAILKDKFGFDTTLLINPTKKEFINAILQYNKINFDSSSQFFLFIAGHGGYTEMAPGYIVFKDTKGPEEDPTQPGAIQHSQLRDWLSTSIRCMHTFVVLDVCYGGNFQSEIAQYSKLTPFNKKKNDEIAQKQAGGKTPGTVTAENIYKAFELTDEQYINNKRGLLTRLFLTSGGKGYTVPDGYKGEHSPFARTFIEALRNKDNLSFGDIKSAVEILNPTPRGGVFDPNSDGDFLFLKKK